MNTITNDAKRNLYKLTVIIRDDSPAILCGDCPAYRTVEIDLTPHQSHLIQLRRTYSSGNDVYYEEISRAILEVK